MARSQGVHPDHVHVGVDGLAGDLGGGLEQGADVDVEAEVTEAGGDHLLAAVVAVLAHLGHQQAGTAPVVGLEGLDHGPGLVHRCVVHPDLPGVHATDDANLGHVAAEHLLHGIGDLTYGGLGSGGIDGKL